MYTDRLNLTTQIPGNTWYLGRQIISFLNAIFKNKLESAICLALPSLRSL